MLLTAVLLAAFALIIDGCQGKLFAQHAEKPARFTIAAIGDLLIHESIFKSAYDGAAYDFKPMFMPVKPYLEGADYTIANLEVPVAGQHRGYSGYPSFNSPVALAYTLRWAGVDMATTANNHCLDRGWTGLASSLDNLDTVGLQHTGTFRSAEEQQEPVIVTIGGVKVGFVAFTYGTNGIPIPKGREYSVNLLREQDVLDAAQRAREQGAQVVLAVLHWGAEYQRQPNTEQQALAKKLLAGGVDHIIAHHPHVVQPISHLTVTRGDQPYTGVVAYSLGNFVSGQRDRYRDSGIILYLTFEKTANGARLVNTQYLPVYVLRGTGGGRVQYRVLPVSPAIAPECDIAIDAAAQNRLKQVGEELKAHLGGDAGVKLYQ